MTTNQNSSNPTDLSGSDSPHFNDDAKDKAEIAAWEEVADGRFMPRRVRGSCTGRALGWTFTVPSSGSDETQ